MPSFKFILVGTEYEQNLGYAARILKNFGVKELRLVSPAVSPTGDDSIMYSKHAHDLLETAKTFKTIPDATTDCDFVVGTSGSRALSKDSLRSPLLLVDFIKKVKKTNSTYAILLGREGTGLSNEEMKQCDFLITVPTDDACPSLNITHALAIFLYELLPLEDASGSKQASARARFFPSATKKERETLLSFFNSAVDAHSENMRNAGRVKLAFKRIMGRALVTDLEARALTGIFSRIGHGGKKKPAR